MSSKAPNYDFKDMHVLCTFKINIGSQNLDHVCIKCQWLYPNQDQDAKLQSGTSSICQSPISGLKGHGCSLHLQTLDREPKFGTWAYQRPVTISKSRSSYIVNSKLFIQHILIANTNDYDLESRGYSGSSRIVGGAVQGWAMNCIWVICECVILNACIFGLLLC